MSDLHVFLLHGMESLYSLILEKLAVNPKAAASIMDSELLKLTDMKAGLKRYGAPDAMLNHIAIRMHEPELAHDQLERSLYQC